MRPLQILLLLTSAVTLLAAAVGIGPAGGRGRIGPTRTDKKYFQEAGPTMLLSHYDGRYFRGEVPYEEHRPALRHLIRSYLTIMRNNLGLETWLAHGTLLGWWWNGRIMPWDYDLDVQVSSTTMDHMAASLNGSLHEYTYLDEATGEAHAGTYLLDVNPYYSKRSRTDGQNMIDARWIDTSNGMFIDITALTEFTPDRSPGIWSCKNYHRYRTRDLYPMRESEFEGVIATIPYNFDKILTEEYTSKSLVLTQWEGYVFLLPMPSLVAEPLGKLSTDFIYVP